MPNPYTAEDFAPTQAKGSTNPYSIDDFAPVKPLKKNYAWSEVLPAAKKNAVQSAVKFGAGVKDAYLRAPIETMRDLPKNAIGVAGDIARGTAELGGGAFLNLLPPETKKQLIAADPTMKKLTEAANRVGREYVDRYGGIENVKRTIAEKPYAFAMDVASLIPGPGAGASRAAQVAHGVAVPTRAINAATSAVARRAIPRVARYIEDVRHPTNALVTRATEGRVPEVLNALRASREIVPGSRPTAAQALQGPFLGAPPGMPGATQPVVAARFAGMGKAAEKRLPTAAVNTKNAQNTARLAQIRQVGRTPADLQAAIAARDADAARNYAASGRVMSTADDDFHNLIFNRPSMGNVMERASIIAAERGRPFQIGTNARAHTTTSTVLGPTGHPVTVNVPAQYAQYSGENLHNIKLALDDLAFDPAVRARFGIGANEVNAIRQTRNELIAWIERTNPAYRNARQQYGLQSGPIDRMRVGQYLEGKLQNPTLAEDTATLRADAFSNSLDNVLNESLGNTNIRRATGQQRAQHIRDVLTPQEMRLVESIQEDLARAKITENQAAVAGRYSDDLENAMSDAVHFSHGNKVANFFIGGANERIADEVARAMQTPQGMARVLQNALNRDMEVSQFRGGYDRAIDALSHNPYAYANQYPAVYNALAAKDDKKKR